MRNYRLYIRPCVTCNKPKPLERQTTTVVTSACPDSWYHGILEPAGCGVEDWIFKWGSFKLWLVSSLQPQLWTSSRTSWEWVGQTFRPICPYNTSDTTLPPPIHFLPVTCRHLKVLPFWDSLCHMLNHLSFFAPSMRPIVCQLLILFVIRSRTLWIDEIH